MLEMAKLMTCIVVQKSMINREFLGLTKKKNLIKIFYLTCEHRKVHHPWTI